MDELGRLSPTMWAPSRRGRTGGRPAWHALGRAGDPGAGVATEPGAPGADVVGQLSAGGLGEADHRTSAACRSRSGRTRRVLERDPERAAHRHARLSIATDARPGGPVMSPAANTHGTVVRKSPSTPRGAGPISTPSSSRPIPSTLPVRPSAWSTASARTPRSPRSTRARRRRGSRTDRGRPGRASPRSALQAVGERADDLGVIGSRRPPGSTSVTSTPTGTDRRVLPCRPGPPPITMRREAIPRQDRLESCTSGVVEGHPFPGGAGGSRWRAARCRRAAPGCRRPGASTVAVRSTCRCAPAVHDLDAVAVRLAFPTAAAILDDVLRVPAGRDHLGARHGWPTPKVSPDQPDR